MTNTNKKFYNHTFVTKAGDDKVFAKISGNLVGKKGQPVAVEVKELNLSGNDVRVGTITLAVNSKLKSSYDYALGKYNKEEEYKDTVFVKIVVWDDLINTLEDRIAKANQLKTNKGGFVTFDFYGLMTEKSYEGKEGVVSYLELTVPRGNKSGIDFKYIPGKGATSNTESVNSENNSEGNKTSDSVDEEIPF